jgi:hypothetical protein
VKRLLLVLCLLSASCARPYTALIQGASGVNGGVIRVSHSATYGYSLETDGCGGGVFQLAGPKGATQDLIPPPRSVFLYLPSGAWTATYAPDVLQYGKTSTACDWRLSLWTPVGN